MKKVFLFFILSALMTGINAQKYCHSLKQISGAIKNDITTPTLVDGELVIPQGVTVMINTEVYFTREAVLR